MSVGDGDGIMAMLTYRTVEVDAWTTIVTIITLYGLPQGGLLPILWSLVANSLLSWLRPDRRLQTDLQTDDTWYHKRDR